MQTLKKAKVRVIKRESGFTLVEVLIVAILLGILAIVIIPRISVSTEDAKLTNNLTHIQDANVAFRSKEDRFRE